MTTDTSESGLESLICTALTGQPCDAAGRGRMGERPAAYGAGWICGDAHDYDREHCLDLAQLSAFLYATQPDTAGLLGLEEDGPTVRMHFIFPFCDPNTRTHHTWRDCAVIRRKITDL